MRDPRIEKLADVLVNYSVRCGKGEKVLVEARGVDAQLINAVVEKVFAAGGYPFVDVIDQSVERALLMGTSRTHCELRAKICKIPYGGHGLLYRYSRGGQLLRTVGRACRQYAGI